METGERLAAYLAGELGADETRVLEAELTRDARLRARLEAIRATDDALASLPDVAPPATFSARLRDAVAVELERQLPAEGDELAARRTRKGHGGTAATRTWWPQVAVAAAVLAVAGIGITQLTGGGGDTAATEEAAEGEMFSATAETEAEAAAGPTVVAAGRTFDADSLRELADDARFDEIVGQGLAGEDAEAAAESFDTAITAESDDAARSAEADQAPAADAAAPADGALTDEDIGLRTVGDVTPEDLEAVRACLPSLLEANDAVIPVYMEIVTFEGQDAIVYGLVSNDPEAETHSRVELWVLGRSDCHPLHFTQVDR